MSTRSESSRIYEVPLLMKGQATMNMHAASRSRRFEFSKGKSNKF